MGWRIIYGIPLTSVIDPTAASAILTGCGRRKIRALP
jgi:hypothetical protein